MRLNITLILVGLTLSFTSTGCIKNKTKRIKSGFPEQVNPDPTNPPPDDGDVKVDPQSPSEVGLGYSLKAEVRYKKKEVLLDEIVDSLELPRDFCKEIESSDCFEESHNIVLGGVDAYDKTIFTPLNNPVPSTPIVVERIGLKACTARLDQDLASPASAAIFGPLKLDSNGVLIGDQKENMTTIVNSLYQRILRRDPESFEVENMLSFAKEVQSIESQKSGYEWARMACFMTFTSAENIFY